MYNCIVSNVTLMENKCIGNVDMQGKEEDMSVCMYRGFGLFWWKFLCLACWSKSWFYVQETVLPVCLFVFKTVHFAKEAIANEIDLSSHGLWTWTRRLVRSRIPSRRNLLCWLFLCGCLSLRTPAFAFVLEDNGSVFMDGWKSGVGVNTHFVGLVGGQFQCAAASHG